MTEKKLFSKKEIPLLCGLLLLCVLLFWLFSRAPQGTRALVEYNGQLLLSRELTALTEPEEITVTGDGKQTLTLLFSADGVQILSSDCPDKTCVKTGKITRAGQSALCLPARIALRLEGKGGADGETY